MMHARWVRLTHWMAAVSVAALAFSGVEILMVHPRLYWGEAGNDLTPPLLELPISRNHRHGGWTVPTPLLDGPGTPVSAGRTFEIFNENGWGRSLHFLAAWLLVIPGVVYLLTGTVSGHFRFHVWPRTGELSSSRIRKEVVDHLHLRIRPATGGPQYGLLQKLAYSVVVFVAVPLAVLTGLTMSPAITASFPFLLSIFGGYQSARTIHFFAFIALGLFVIAHVVMVVMSGFTRQMRGMIFGR